MEDIYDLTFDEILDYLEELGSRLDVRKNDYISKRANTAMPLHQDQADHGCLLRAHGPMFDRHRIRAMVDFNIGVPYLEGWVEKDMGKTTVGIRAYGARTLHIVAGNGPVLGALTILRGAVTRRTPSSRCRRTIPSPPVPSLGRWSTWRPIIRSPSTWQSPIGAAATRR